MNWARSSWTANEDWLTTNLTQPILDAEAMPTEISLAFSATYQEARHKFLQAASAAGAQHTAWKHPLPGADGEELALDAALLDPAGGPSKPVKLLVVSSACHGVEGYCGSGVQVQALRHPVLLKQAQKAGVALLLLHGLNPYGFSHTRRVTHENVDLNRNFLDFSKMLPRNPAYVDLHLKLLPQHWPPKPVNVAKIMWYLGTRGMKAAQQALSGGQYEVPDGLFFGGTSATWSNATLREVLRHYGTGVAQLAWIDLHSGLGEKGACERTFAMRRGDVVGQARARAWWDGGGATPLKSLDDGSSVSAALTGLMWPCVYDECPASEVTMMAMEFGTVPKLQVLKALRGDHWLYQQQQKALPVAAELVAQIKKELRDAFYVDTDLWKSQVVEQGVGAIAQAAMNM